MTSTSPTVHGGAPDPRPALFVTGGSRGLGAALVRHFAHTHHVGFCWLRSETEAGTLRHEVSAAGGLAMAFRCDVTDAGAMQSTAAAFSRVAGPCQALIHTTGTFNELPLADTGMAEWQEELNTTVTAGFTAWKAFAPQLLGHDRSRVIFIGDSAAEQLRARNQATGYYVGKHGLVLLARTIAAEQRDRGLTCNVVSPGVLPNSIDLHRPGMKVNVSFAEIAGIVEFLLSAAADAISGSHIVASRGWNL